MVLTGLWLITSTLMISFWYLDESSTEGFEEAFRQRGLSAVSEGAGKKQRRLLLNGRVLVVHHSQDVLRKVLEGCLAEEKQIRTYEF